MRHPLMVTAAVLFLAVPALAGCLTGVEDAGDVDREEDSTAARVPGCDEGPTAVAHGPGARVGSTEPDLPVACFVRTGFTSEGEPTIGFSDGTLWMSTAYEPGESTPYRYGALRSPDDGATWELVRPTLAGEDAHRVQADPYLYVDPATGRVFFDNLLTVNCSLLSWTDDQGSTWEHSLSGCMETDHQTIFTGPPTVSSTHGYPNVVYRCAINTVATSLASWSDTCQRSLDGGLTWLPPGAPAFHADPRQEGNRETPGNCPGGIGHGVTDPEGRVYLPKGWCGQPWLAMSDDEGLTWTRVQVADNGILGYAERDHGHDAAVAVDEAGNVYYAWVAADWLPYLSVSTDRGASWSEPIMLGPPDVTDAALIALTAGSSGRIAWSYMGTTNGPGGVEFCDGVVDCWDGEEDPDHSNVTWRGYLGMTTTALTTAPMLLTAAVHEDPFIIGRCGPIRCAQLKDFIDVVIGPDGTPWAPFVDACPDPCTELSDEPNGEGVVGRLWGGPSLWTTDAPAGR